jgi:hypothetical protein
MRFGRANPGQTLVVFLNSLRSFTSTTVAPPTRITATPPACIASRSCSFSAIVVGAGLLDLGLICAIRVWMSDFSPAPLIDLGQNIGKLASN